MKKTTHKPTDLDKIVYQLTVEDIQNVAEQELEREMSLEEIEQLEDLIAKRVNWFDAIADAIDELTSKKQ